VPGTFVDIPAAGTTPGVGSGPVVTVTFTPAAATNSITATASVRIDVAAASPPADTTPPTIAGFRTTGGRTVRVALGDPKVLSAGLEKVQPV
jgi:hypothetical protein